MSNRTILALGILSVVTGLICCPACSARGSGPPPVTGLPAGSADLPPYQEGIASWYGKKFHRKRTSNGEIYNMDRLTAAHRLLPFHTYVLVENLNNNRQVTVRINDRGPFVKGRIIDLSRRAAERIGILEEGTAPVRLYLLKTPAAAPESPPAPTDREETPVRYTIQAGAFTSVKNAVLTMEKINSIIVSYRFEVQRVDGYYKVMLRTPAPLNTTLRILDILKDHRITAFKREVSGQ